MARSWPELVWAADHDRSSISRAHSRRDLEQLASGLYTGTTNAPAEQVVSRNIFRILARELPGAIIADRSAASLGSYVVGGVVYVVHARRQPLVLPGVTVSPRPGPQMLPGDDQLTGGLFIASPARTMLDSLARTADRYLTQPDVEQWIERIMSSAGEDALNTVREQARLISPRLRTARSLKILNQLISAALSTGDTRILQTQALVARSKGKPFDANRIGLFSALVTQLQSTAPQPFLLNRETGSRRTYLPNYEAYFSNYIEGTEFTIDDAMAIMKTGAIPADRPADAHDILGTFRIVNDPQLRARTPVTSDDLVNLVRRHHLVLMAGHPNMTPGEFKDRANRAGQTDFVVPAAVEGTLRQGFDLAASLIDPFLRATYLMFLVSEVHPFADGNGRVSRIMMNAELSAQDQPRIIIPTVYRNEYLTALRAASRNANFNPLIAVLYFAQRYTNRIDYTSRGIAEAQLVRTNAFKDSTEAEREGFRLELP